MNNETRRALAEQLMEIKQEAKRKINANINTDFWQHRHDKAERELTKTLKEIDPVASW